MDNSGFRSVVFVSFCYISVKLSASFGVTAEVKGSVPITVTRVKAVVQSLNYVTQLMTLPQIRIIYLIFPSNREKW